MCDTCDDPGLIMCDTCDDPGYDKSRYITYKCYYCIRNNTVCVKCFESCPKCKKSICCVCDLRGCPCCR